VSPASGRSAGAAEQELLAVLLVGAGPDDEVFFRALLSQPEGSGAFDLRASASLADAMERLIAAPGSVVLLNVAAADRGGLNQLERLQAVAPDAAVLVLWAQEDGDAARALLRAGAADVIRRSELSGRVLWRALRYARERASAMRQARTTDVRFRRSIEAAPDAVITSNAEGRIVGWNEAARTVFGWDAAEVLGRSLVEIIIPPELNDRYEGSFARRGAGPGHPLHRFETEALRRDGTRITVQVALARIEEPGGALLTAFIRDISTRVAAEAELRKARDYNESLLNSMPGVMALVGADGRIKKLGANTVRLTGYTLDDLPDNVLDLVVPEQRVMAESELRRCIETGSSSAQVTFLNRNGARLPLELTGTRIQHGGEVELLIVGLDLTERQEMQSRLVHAQKLESVGRLAGGVAHDFNNSLMAILSFTELALMDTPQHDPRYESLLTVKEAALRAADLTRQLLAFGRRQVLMPQLLNVDSLIAGVEKMLRRMIREDIELVTNLGAADLRVNIDPGQFEASLLNLVINARDAMPGGGRIEITTESVQGAACRPGGATTGHCVRITVSDSGEGMSPEVLERAFEPFFTTKGAGIGTGLGLSSVYGFVEQSGGEIRIESRVGSGTRVLITLPESAAAAAATGAPVPGAARGSEVILLVEDNPAVRQGLGETLHSRGYTVLLASHGAEAIRVSDEYEGRIDLGLFDVVMPGMSIMELREALRQRRPEMRTLLMSGYTDAPAVLQAAADGSVPFISKPFTADRLADKIRGVLGGS
jgi:two-component system cell cycle sensor histidine kinase/response regulator CckA